MRTYAYYNTLAGTAHGFHGEITDSETGQVIHELDGYAVFGDNWMAHSLDLLGLHQYLEHHGIIKQEDGLYNANNNRSH